MSDDITKLITDNMQKMLEWEIELSKQLEHGCILTIRKGTFIDKEWYAVFLEAQIGNEEHLLDIPPQNEWGDFALMSFQTGDRGMVLWVYQTFDELVPDMSRLFGMFLPKGFPDL